MSHTIGNKHKIEIDLASVIFCIFVVVIHLLSQTVLELGGKTLSWRITYGFQRILFCAIYGFMFLSGLKSFLNRDEAFSIKDYYAGRFKKIILPYAAAILTYWVVLFVLGLAELKPHMLARYFFLGSLAAHFYFVIAIAQFYLLYPLTKKILSSYSVRIILLVSAVLNIISVVLLCKNEFFNRLFVRYLFCYMLGAVIATHYESFTEMAKKHFIKILIIYIVALSAEETAAYAYVGNDISYRIQQVITVIYMPAAVVFWFALCVRVAPGARIAKTAIFKAVSRNTYHIYLWHMLAILVVNSFLTDSEGFTVMGELAIRTGITLASMAVLIIMRSFKKKGLYHGTEKN